MKAQAKLHGAKIKDDPDEDKGFFKDPSEYKDMSEEEKQSLTNDMKAKFMGFAKNKGLG